jgi:hypothetical protein
MIFRILPFLLTLTIAGQMAAQTARFEIIKGDDVIGSITATCERSGSRVTYRMDSRSEISLIWTQVIETSMNALYNGEHVDVCGMTVHVNGSMRDSTYMSYDGSQNRCYVHPDQAHDLQNRIKWTTARMYFQEPVDVRSVFVESLLQDHRLERKEAGRYTLNLPGDTQNHYYYVNGTLREIRVDRPFFDLVFRRV